LIVRKYDDAGVFMGRLSAGDDLLEKLGQAVREVGVQSGAVTFIGALSRAKLGFYDQDSRSYETIDLDSHLEIAAGTANVSLKDGEPFVHAHAVLSERSGRAFGGHVMPGTVVFACEFVIQKFDGRPLVRVQDPGSGLALWKG